MSIQEIIHIYIYIYYMLSSNTGKTFKEKMEQHKKQVEFNTIEWQYSDSSQSESKGKGKGKV